MKNVALIIAAGGKGSRFGSQLPKQFIPIDGIPVIVKSILPFMGIVHRVVVSIAKGYEQYLLTILPSEIKDILTIVEGGTTRYDSVKNALRELTETTSLVAVHDAARPYVDKEMISRVIEKASECGAAIPVAPIVDSIREIKQDGSSVARDRSRYAFVQTPQVFETSLLKQAYMQPYNPVYTDDASLVESMGIKVFTVAGSLGNIKITYKSDL